MSARGWRRSAGAEINAAKKVLADEATTLLHGSEAAEAAGGAARAAFEEGRVSANLPTHDVPRGTLAEGDADGRVA